MIIEELETDVDAFYHEEKVCLQDESITGMV